LLASCQATSGRYKKFDLTCTEMSPYLSEMNWEIWGQSKRIEKCTGGTAFLEKYFLHNGYVSYQGLSDIDSYFPLVTERTYREALSSHPSFKDNWRTAKMFAISTTLRNVHYSFFEWSEPRSNCVYFNMGHGNRMNFTSADGWNETAYGSVCDFGKLTPVEFQNAFETRIHAFNVRTNKGAKNTAGFTPWVSEGSAENQKNRRKLSELSDKSICNFATSGSISNRQWEDHSLYQEHVNEAKRRGLTIDDCMKQ
jgi:hypothetical protein